MFFVYRLWAVIIVAVLLSMSFKLHAQPYFPVRVNKLWGVIDSNGVVIIKPVFDDIKVSGKNNNFIAAELGDSTFLINSRLQIVARTAYAAIYELGEGMFKTQLRKKSYKHQPLFGFMDSTGKIITEPKFSSIEPFRDGVAKVNIYIDTTGNYKKENERGGIIDKKGNWLIQPTYATYHITSSSDGLINFYEKGKGWGAMDVTTKIIIEPKYNSLGSYKYGYMVYSNSKYSNGLMKIDGTATIPDDGMHMVSYYPLSPVDTLVIVHQVKFIQRNGVPYRNDNGKIYSVNGKFLYDIQYEECLQQNNGFFLVSNKEMKRGMMNASGKIVVEPGYRVLQWFQPGLKQVEKNGKWGFIDDAGREIIPCTYEDSEPFKNGLAAIYVGGRRYDYIFPDKYPNIKMGYINRKGDIIWAPSR